MKLIDADEIRIKPEYMHDICGTVVIRVEDIARIINDMPTINPEPPWIPCSERPPENDDEVIITVLDDSGDYPLRYSDCGWYLDKADCWIVGAEQRTDVIAWMPFPKPYKPEDGFIKWAKSVADERKKGRIIE